MRSLLLACAATLFAAGAASAQVPGQLGGAVPLGVNEHTGGVYAAMGSGQSSLYGMLRMSFYPAVDFGFFGGLRRIDHGESGRTAVEMGADLRGAIVRRGDTSPVDVSLGGVLGVSSADHFTLMSIGPSGVVSRTRALENNASITPYAGAALLYTRSTIGDQNSTDLSMPLRFGAEYRPNLDIHLVAEFQLALSDPTTKSGKLVLGASFPF